MKKFTAALLAFSVMALFATSVFAQPQQGPNRGHEFRRPMPGRILAVLKVKQKELNVTDKQLEKIKTLTIKMEEKMVQHKNDMNTLRLELKKLMLDKENQDYEKIKTMLSKISYNRNEAFIYRLKHREEISNILTPEQQEALKAVAKDRMGHGRRFFRDRDAKRFPRFRNRFIR
jgi:Spy/CpxP family protein refolding chaperone